MTNNKGPIILYYGAEQKKIVSEIDDKRFLSLQVSGGSRESNTSRTDLFLFAMALGLESKTKTPIKQPDTLIRSEYMSPNSDAFLYAAYVNELKSKEDLEVFSNKSAIYKSAQEYATTGFDLIGAMIKNKTDLTVAKEMIKDMDKSYEEYFGKTDELE